MTDLTPIERFDSNYDYFIHKLDILRKINDEILPQAIQTQMGARRIQVIVNVGKGKKKNENLVEIIKDYEKKTFGSKDKLLEEMHELMKSEILSDNISKFIREMSLVYLIIAFEEYLSSILKVVFSSRPEILKGSEIKISYAEAFPHKYVHSLLNSLIDKEVKSIIDENIDEVNKRLNRIFSIDLGKKAKWKLFREYFLRRNILVHNNCYPDSTYIKKTQYKGPATRLEIRQEYLSEEFRLFEKYATLLRNFFRKKLSNLEKILSSSYPTLLRYRI
jgi:nucleoside diphosphate kinase